MDPTTAPPEPSRLRLWAAGALVSIAAVAALYTWAALSYPYSRGERVGFVQKFSRQGWVCKTWEGELVMPTMPGVAPEKFHFSTSSAPVASQLNGTLGQRVRVRYVQHKFVPTTCFGETEYFVADSQPVQ